MESFNKIGKQNGGKAFSAKDIPLGEPFVYKHLGSMASVGSYKALVDLRQSKVNLSDTYFLVKTMIRLNYASQISATKRLNETSQLLEKQNNN